ncbi:MAG: glycosyltransferase [Acidobacteria bacterium]|nr:MAG: glycosyltransferase [Acidobacteriota bacterium]
MQYFTWDGHLACSISATRALFSTRTSSEPGQARRLSHVSYVLGDLLHRRFANPFLFVLFSILLIAAHAPLLRLQYFWDEAGYYVPAAFDLSAGSLIPHSTPSNAHPPLVLAWLALCWKLFGFHPAVTRCAMLLLAAFSLLGFFRLALAVSNFRVAAWATLLTAAYPVFFTQSSLAQVDLPAAGLIFWGLESYFRRRIGVAVIWFSLAALAKETAILVPLALFLWEIALAIKQSLRALIFTSREAAEHESPARQCREQEADQGESRQGRHKNSCETDHIASAAAKSANTREAIGGTTGTRALPGWKSALVLLVPIIPLAAWYAYHYFRTGFIFGNPEFFHYNVQATLHPLRIVLALLLRVWQTAGYMNLYLLTIACALAMRAQPIQTADGPRPRIAVPVQLGFLAVAAVYVITLAVVGGAVLARYMLPVVPLVILVCVSTVCRRLHLWNFVLIIVAVAFVAGLFVNPPYGFAPEDNLAYRDYIHLHQDAERWLQARYPKARVLTAWPASGEVTKPYLGYVDRPMQVVQIEDFTAEQLLSAADVGSRFDVALVFSTKYQPRTIFDRWRKWQEWKARYFGFHLDLPPEAAASVLGGRLVYVERKQGQWVGIIEIVKIEEALIRTSKAGGDR